MNPTPQADINPQVDVTLQRYESWKRSQERYLRKSRQWPNGRRRVPLVWKRRVNCSSSAVGSAPSPARLPMMSGHFLMEF